MEGITAAGYAVPSACLLPVSILAGTPGTTTSYYWKAVAVGAKIYRGGRVMGAFLLFFTIVPKRIETASKGVW